MQPADLLRVPDGVTARFATREVVRLQYAAHAWTCPGVRLTTEPAQTGPLAALPIRVTNQGRDLTYIHVRWQARQRGSLLTIGDAWERSYGDLEWRSTVPDRVMPWYFLTFDGERVDGYGVQTGASSFCFWQRDDEGITLTIDLRNGGLATQLGARELHACTVITRQGSSGETIHQAAREFCGRMCAAPRLPAGAIYGANDWNYAYGRNSAAGILRDADLIASLAPASGSRPHIVIDDGWQDPSRFPSMPELARQIRSRHLQPGLWVRPLRAAATSPASWLLPDARFGNNAPHSNIAFDPTLPEALNEAMQSVRDAVQWGYDFIKHDFTTYELFGRWGFEMKAEVTAGEWHFHDRSRTNAEIVTGLYRAIRAAAGETATILGCNTVGHLAAGIFESQRITDDTSGRDWERTRRYGVNGLAHRMAQHRTFSHIDPDCVAITAAVDWRQTSQWMDVVAASGTSLFLSPEPSSITPEIRSAMKDAMLLASQQQSGFPSHPSTGTTPEDWTFPVQPRPDRRFTWCPQDGTSPFAV